MKYYKVTVKCGHVGKNYYLLKELFIKADNKKIAAKKARETPRVKHNHKDAIRNVVEMEKKEYYLGIETKNKDMYFKCCNSYEQRLYCHDIYK